MKKTARSAKTAKSSKSNEQLFALVVVILVVVGALAIFINASTMNTDNRSDASNGMLGINPVPTIQPAPPYDPNASIMPPMAGKNFWITAPMPGTVLMKNTSVVLSADATDDAVSYITFSIDGMVLCTKHNLPYQCSWRIPKEFKSGDMVLTAAMYNRAGEKTGTDMIGVTIK